MLLLDKSGQGAARYRNQSKPYINCLMSVYFPAEREPTLQETNKGDAKLLGLYIAGKVEKLKSLWPRNSTDKLSMPTQSN